MQVLRRSSFWVWCEAQNTRLFSEVIGRHQAVRLEATLAQSHSWAVLGTAKVSNRDFAQAHLNRPDDFRRTGITIQTVQRYLIR